MALIKVGLVTSLKTKKIVTQDSLSLVSDGELKVGSIVEGDA